MIANASVPDRWNAVLSDVGLVVKFDDVIQLSRIGVDRIVATKDQGKIISVVELSAFGFPTTCFYCVRVVSIDTASRIQPAPSQIVLHRGLLFQSAYANNGEWLVPLGIDYFRLFVNVVTIYVFYRTVKFLMYSPWTYRDRRNRCTKCGYPRLLSAAQCPECGSLYIISAVGQQREQEPGARREREPDG